MAWRVSVLFGRLATAMDREEVGRAYLEQHKILELLHNLSALLLYHRPGEVLWSDPSKRRRGEYETGLPWSRHITCSRGLT